MVDAPDDQGFLVKSDSAAGSVAIPPRPGEALPLGDKARAPKTDDGSRLSVDQGISLSGEVTSCDKLCIEGSVEAKLTNCRIIEIAEGGLFKGSTTIDEAEVRGRFEGDVVVHNRLLIGATGRVSGTIRYGQIEIECGGEIFGDIQAQPSRDVSEKPPRLISTVGGLPSKQSLEPPATTLWGPPAICSATFENTAKARHAVRPRVLRCPSSTETPQTLTTSEPRLYQLAPFPPVTKDGGAPAFADKEPEPITLTATSVSGGTPSTGFRGAARTLRYFAVVGLIAVGISASFGGFFFLIVHANRTSVFLEPNRAHSPQSNFEPAPVLGEAEMPPSPAAPAISGRSPASRATASAAAPMPSRHIEVSRSPPVPKSAPSAEIVPELEQRANLSASPRETANPSPTAEPGSLLSQGTIKTPAPKKSTTVDYQPERDAGLASSVRSHSARSSVSQKTGRPDSSGRLTTHVTTKTKAVGQTLRPPAAGAADPFSQRTSGKSAVEPNHGAGASTIGAVP